MKLYTSKWERLKDELEINSDAAFTAQKQLDVVELLSAYGLNSFSYRLTDSSELEWTITSNVQGFEGHGKSYNEALADLLIKLYPILLEARQQAIKKILGRED